MTTPSDQSEAPVGPPPSLPVPHMSAHIDGDGTLTVTSEGKAFTVPPPDIAFGMDWTDRRKVEDIAFGIEIPEVDRAAAVAWFREKVLAPRGITSGEGLRQLGCTTLSDAFTIAELQRIRMILGGSGVGLTCFVPSNLYCLVHETVGGLQEGQDVLGADKIGKVSRELTRVEAQQVGRIEAVRRMRNATDTDRLEVLRGNVDPEGIAEDPGPALDRPPPTPSTLPPRVEASWRCDYHQRRDWGCRHCLAEALVAGEIAPKLLVTDGVEFEQIAGDAELHDAVSALDKRGVDAAAVYVKIGRFSRRLALED